MQSEAVPLSLSPVHGESGRAAPPAPLSLGALVDLARRRSGGYVLTAVRHGAPDATLDLLLAALRGYGVCESPALSRSELDRTGVSVVQLQARGSGPAADPLPVLMVIAGGDHHLLLPAVQKVREAAARLQLPADFDVLAVAPA